jgi:uncharacterized protein YcaQ
VRLLAPFDPWYTIARASRNCGAGSIRFELTLPSAKRKLGYYAHAASLARSCGWLGQRLVKDGRARCEFGICGLPARERVFKRELELELDRFRVFLGRNVTGLFFTTASSNAASRQPPF